MRKIKQRLIYKLKTMLQTWNMTVQYWLAVNVYRRLPGLSRGLRSLVVMVVSSAWHGVYPGMYIQLSQIWRTTSRCMRVIRLIAIKNCMLQRMYSDITIA